MRYPTNMNEEKSNLRFATTEYTEKHGVYIRFLFFFSVKREPQVRRDLRGKLFISDTLLLIVFVLLFCAMPLFSQDRIVDNVGLLSAGQKEELKKLADSLTSVYNFDLVIVTEKSIGAASPAAYADDFFDEKGYGIGQNRDGCLFLHVTGSRDFYFSTSGRGIKLLNSTAFSKLESGALNLLGEKKNYEAYRAFLHNWEEFLGLEANGRSYNFFYRWNALLVSAAWLIALLIGFWVVAAWKFQMNTALPQTNASAYIIPGSFNFTEKKERFLYSNISKIKRQTSSADGIAKGGIHTGSSGNKHGGGGRKY